MGEKRRAREAAFLVGGWEVRLDDHGSRSEEGQELRHSAPAGEDLAKARKVDTIIQGPERTAVRLGSLEKRRGGILDDTMGTTPHRLGVIGVEFGGRVHVFVNVEPRFALTVRGKTGNDSLGTTRKAGEGGTVKERAIRQGGNSAAKCNIVRSQEILDELALGGVVRFGPVGVTTGG